MTVHVSYTINDLIRIWQSGSTTLTQNVFYYRKQDFAMHFLEMHSTVFNSQKTTAFPNVLSIILEP